MHTDSVQVSVTVPAALADADTAERARVLLVLDAVRSERLTWRMGADVLGIAPDAFLDLARAYGIPSHRYDETDLQQDLDTLASLDGRRRIRG